MSDPELERELDQLREAYRSKLRREIETLSQKLRDARAAGAAPEPLEAARQLAHRLKGTSGSYGLDASSAALARIEDQLELLPGLDRGPIWDRIELALDQARSGLLATSVPS